jgi:hypothetical protein
MMMLDDVGSLKEEKEDIWEELSYINCQLPLEMNQSISQCSFPNAK